MITKNEAKAYAGFTLDLLYKMKIKITPTILEEQMDLIYDVYEPYEIEELYNNMKESNKILYKNISGNAYCYIINSFNSSKQQIELIKKFCGTNIEIGKIYISPPGENTEHYYKLIKDIRNKEMDILFMNIYTILSMSERERSMIVHLCRENNIFFIEV